jgi:hypothetical protein
MLVLGGSYDFTSVEEYQCWVREVIEREHNALLPKSWPRNDGICTHCRRWRCPRSPR